MLDMSSSPVPPQMPHLVPHVVGIVSANKKTSEAAIREVASNSELLKEAPIRTALDFKARDSDPALSALAAETLNKAYSLIR
jgi:hypothetical protein